jgi:SAM-dependent methyltransferase
VERLTWAEAVMTLRNDPKAESLVKACYFDDPLIDAAHRFWRSQEWIEVSKILPSRKGSALDLGAGRGISSFALAKDGWSVTSLEPDPSSLVGAGAIRSLACVSNLGIKVVSDYSETLPFPANTFDLVYCRQALHHACNLRQTCKEIARVLKPKGILIATREHVISKPEDLHVFLAQHPLHYLYGGENAFLLSEYKDAIRLSGLKLMRSLAPLDTAINYFPSSEKDINNMCVRHFSKLVGSHFATILMKSPILGSACRRTFIIFVNSFSKAPGRLYSFIAVKPSPA